MAALPYLDLLPLLVLAAGVGLVLLTALVPWARGASGWAAVLAIVAAFVCLVGSPTIGEDPSRTLASGEGVYAPFAALVLLGGLFAVLLALPYLRREEPFRGEFLALILLSTLGGVALAAARDLLLLFVSLEVLTLPLYVLAGYYRRHGASVEASVKYFFIGILSTAFFLYGVALLYGATGSLDTEAVRAALVASPELAQSPLVRVSLGLVLVGIGFKIAAVPFHFWVPDVYQGAPTPVTAFLAVASKAGGFAVALRLLVVAYAPLAGLWTGLFSVLAAATLVLGALLALLQEDLKRLLAYSSIAHAGYLMVAIVVQGRTGNGTGAGAPLGIGTQALLFYLLSYAVTAGGAFAVLAWWEGRYGGPVRISDYEGLARRHPVMSAALAFSMLSLAGIPPTGGFVAKYVLLRSAIESRLWGLALVAALAAVVGLFYYLRVVVAMYLRPVAEGGSVAARPLGVASILAVGGSAIGVLLLGIWPGPVLELLARLPVP